LEKVFNYIKNQKVHHVKKSFKDEYDEYLKLYGFERSPRLKSWVMGMGALL